MKYLIVLSFILLFTASQPITTDCKCSNIPLFGRVKFVKYNADFKIQFTEHGHPDLFIKFVSQPAVKCGQWQVVDDREDFSVQIVDYGADFVVKYDPDRTGVN